jgi:uncharacterized protein (UPF0548 family)
MYFLKEPTNHQVSQFIASQAEQPFSYPEVGATQRTLPAGYAIDRNRVQLGRGSETFEAAAAAVRRWQQFELGWVKIVPDTTPIEVGRVVAIKARTFGFWTLSACRIVYVIGDESPERRIGFAYGTLTDHVERGEERFLIEWLEDDSVWYEILAFSRPQHALVRLAAPMARQLQKRFARDSKRRMLGLMQNEIIK